MENQKVIEIEEITEKDRLNDDQRIIIYKYVTTLSKATINEISPALLRIALDSDKGPLKNELGRTIFHLQKLERLNTLIGVQKLIDACMTVNPNEMFKVLQSSDEDAQELAKKIKRLL